MFTALTVRVEGYEPLGSKYPLVLNLWVLFIVSVHDVDSKEDTGDGDFRVLIGRAP